LTRKRERPIIKSIIRKVIIFSAFREPVVGGNRQWKIMKWADAKNEFEAIKIR